MWHNNKYVKVVNGGGWKGKEKQPKQNQVWVKISMSQEVHKTIDREHWTLIEIRDGSESLERTKRPGARQHGAWSIRQKIIFWIET